MAAVIREGGTNPLKVKTWQDGLKVALLERMYDDSPRGTRKDDFYSRLGRYLYQGNNDNPKCLEHRITREDVDAILKEMFKDGWIEVAEFPCECCFKVERTAEENFNHARRFRLTREGYARVPEHIFP